MYNIVAIVNTILYTGNLLRINLEHSCHIHKLSMLVTWGYRHVNYLDLGNHTTMYMYIK